MAVVRSADKVDTVRQPDWDASGCSRGGYLRGKGLGEMVSGIKCDVPACQLCVELGVDVICEG